MANWDETRRVMAKRLFGRVVRVALAEWIAERDYSTFYLLEAQRGLDRTVGGAGSAVSQEISLMCEMGMLSRVPDGRRVYFVPNPASGLWQAFEAISAALEGADVATDGSRSTRH